MTSPSMWRRGALWKSAPRTISVQGGVTRRRFLGRNRRRRRAATQGPNKAMDLAAQDIMTGDIRRYTVEQVVSASFVSLSP